MFMHNASMTREIREVPIESAQENVRIDALIIHRWIKTNPEEIIEWNSANPHLQLLSTVVSTIDDLIFTKALKKQTSRIVGPD